jgi:hypothetical protein
VVSSSDLTPTNSAVSSSVAPGAELSAASINNLDTIDTPGLNAGTNDLENDTLTAPTAPGTYYLSVIADNTGTGNQGSNTGNDTVHSTELFGAATGLQVPKTSVAIIFVYDRRF